VLYLSYVDKVLANKSRKLLNNDNTSIIKKRNEKNKIFIGGLAMTLCFRQKTLQFFYKVVTLKTKV